MLHKGPISRLFHGVFDYAVGALLVAGPFLFDFDSDAARAVAVVVGVAMIALAASSEGITGLVDQIALPAHAVLDFVIALVLIASPFVFGFTDDGAPTALLMVAGLALLLVSIGTSYQPASRSGDT